MFFEDARDLSLQAVKLLESQKDVLGCPDLKIWSLVDFNNYAERHPLTRRQKEIIVDQALLLVDQFYAHLPFKRARYAADPVQSLRLIRAELDGLNDLAFHERMLQTMVSLRDAHTFYSLPFPYQGAFAFLPFWMQCFHEKSGKRKYIVTQVLDGFEHSLFTVDSEITSWNGVPTEQAVEREGMHDPGANPSSRLARSILRMCNRSLALTGPPKESFIVVGYVPAKGPVDEFGIVMPWHICTNGIYSNKRQGTKASVNENMAHASRTRKVLFHRQELMEEVKAERAGPAAASKADGPQQSRYPNALVFQHSGGSPNAGCVDPKALRDPAHPEKKFGYIRIKTFEPDAADKGFVSKFVAEFERIVRLLREAAPDGLALDVRSNPGGSIQAAERILQYLTPGSIEPAAFHFISSPTTQRIASVLQHSDKPQPEWGPWIPHLLSSVIMGNTLTPGVPLTFPEDANDTGQIYQGPVTLIIDALAYSATDIFCGDFQDHKIGTLIGVDDNTGGGGANRWLHDELWQNLKQHGLHDVPLQALPAGAQLGLAIRRCSRVGEHEGSAIEDEGVKADIRYRATRKDLLNNDSDLLAFACAHLGSQPAYVLKIDEAALTPEGFDVTVTTRNLFRLECVADTLFNQGSVNAIDGRQSFKISTTGLLATPGLLQINGFAQYTSEAGMTKLKLAATDSRLFDESLPSPVASAAVSS